MAQRFKSVLKKVKLSDTDSTSRKDPGVTPPGISREQPHWLRWSLEQRQHLHQLCPCLRNLLYLSSLTVTLSALFMSALSKAFLQLLGSHQLLSLFEYPFNNFICLRSLCTDLNYIHFSYEAWIRIQPFFFFSPSVADGWIKMGFGKLRTMRLMEPTWMSCNYFRCLLFWKAIIRR